MKNIIPNNTEVLIFNSNMDFNSQLDTTLIEGKVISSHESDDLSQHGSPWIEQIYSVQGEDGNIYKGTYESPIIGSHYFMTIEDFKKNIVNRIQYNNEVIKDLQIKNKEYLNIIEKFDKKELCESEKQFVKHK